MAKIIIKHNPTPGCAPRPGDLSPAELAINSGDGTLYTKLEDGSVAVIGGTTTPVSEVTLDGGNF